MSPPPPARPRLILAFFRLFALLGAVPFLINTVDILLHLSAPALDPTFGPLLRFLLGLVVAPLILVIAVLCIRRAPANLVGWMLVAFAYGASAQVMGGDLLPLDAAVQIGNFFIGPFWFAFLLIPLYFPDGQLYPARASRWGNPLLSFLFFATVVVSRFCLDQFTWGTGIHKLKVPNPFLVFAWHYQVVTIPMILSLLVAGIVTVIRRYRGSRALERLQLRWLLFGVLLQSGLSILVLGLLQDSESLQTWTGSFYYMIIPLAIGIAVLRYRLYDIDLIIRRTLQYGLLSFALGLVYFGGVTLLQQVFVSAAGTQSPLVVVLSTLLIVLLFNPLRRRIQAFIDRRFFRQKYDPGLLVARLDSLSRNQVDPQVLSATLVTIVNESLQPQSLDLWLKESSRKEGSR